MPTNPLTGFRLKMFRALQVLVPEGSSLDAIFNSYDDWRRYRAQFSKSLPAPASASSLPSEQSSPDASQQLAQPDSSQKQQHSQ